MPEGMGQHALTALAQERILRQSRLLSLEELRPFANREIVAASEGLATVNSQDVTLTIGVNRRFPHSLPTIFIRPWDSLGFIPHVDEDGFVCYADGEGLVLNAQNPEGILREALARALRVLEDGASGRNRWDFLDEFRAHWLRVAKSQIQSFFEPTSEARQIRMFVGKNGYAFAAENEHELLNYHYNRVPLASMTQRTALYLPLQDGTFLTPPTPGVPWTANHVKKLVRGHLSQANLRILDRLGRKWKTEEFVILSIPRPSGGVTLVGLRFRDVNDGHPLIDGSANEQPQPLRVERHDKTYLLPRGGGDIDLSKFKILIAGCGSVGGYIPFSLAQAGLSHITLVDPNKMRLENTYRHVLGRSALEQAKVSGLKTELERKFPYLSITPVQARIEEAFSQGSVDLANFDLAIFALGDPTLELEINRVLRVQSAGPNAVFTWLEPYGIGGHAILTRLGTPGCFQCLFTSVVSNGEAPLHNRASFVAPGQFFGLDSLGCGSLYMPYGALDAQRTAELATRLALDGLKNEEPLSPLLSWKGSPVHFQAAGFKVSERYELNSDELFDQRYAYVAPTCSICGKKP